jgi:LuxR family maltose regulon positive regulatory protein
MFQELPREEAEWMQHSPKEELLLTTKLSIPPVYLKKSIPRPHLYEKLERAIQGSCTLVTAPAGFGKTSLVSDWLNYAHPQAAWVTLDGSDNDPTRFWRYMVSALGKQVSAVSELLGQWLQAKEPLDSETMLMLLINALAEAPRDILLVLDDYQSIVQASIHQMVAFLLEHQPTQFHLIVLSRSDPPLPLARLRVKGQLSELRAHQLRFTLDEANTFLSKMIAFTLHPQEIARLYKYTEGWPAGLQLAAISLQKYTDATAASHFIRSYSGENRQTFHYLTQEVLAQQPEEVTDFLLMTAILESFTAELCDAVTMKRNAQKIIEELFQHDLFLVALDDLGQWYRYHHLFIDILRHHLKQQMAAELPELHHRASSWYEGQNLYAEAIAHAFQAPDIERAARLIEQYAWPFMQRGEFMLVNSWLTQLPDKFSDGRPLIAYLQASMYMRQTRFHEYEQAIEKAEKIWQEDQNKQMLSHVFSTRAFKALVDGSVAQTIAYAQKALEFASIDVPSVQASATIALGSGYYLQGEIVQARNVLIKGYHLSQKEYQTMMSRIAAIYLADIQISQGKLSEAIQSLRQLLLDDMEEHTLWYKPSVHLHISAIYREWNDLPTAQAHLQQAGQFMDKQTAQSLLPTEYLVSSARLTWTQGQPEQALYLLDQAEQQAQLSPRNSMMQIQISALRIQILLAYGKVDEANDWVQMQHPEQEQISIYEQEAWLIAQARLFLAQQKYEQAFDILEGPLRLAREQGRRASIIALQIQQAQLYHAQGATSQAFQNLEQALGLARTGGYVRIFLDEGQAMGQLLNEYCQRQQRRTQSEQQSIEHSYIHSVLRAFGPDMQMQSLSSINMPEEPLEKLSEREFKVLHLIAEGLSNQEIARSLQVSVSTIKTHLNNVYAKLHVHTRLQAVTRAYDLGILRNGEQETEAFTNYSFSHWGNDFPEN